MAKLNGADVSASFKPDPANVLRFVALVTGLKEGANTLEASAGGDSAQWVLTHYPISGSILSGPQITPFTGQTDAFNLPDGSKLGAATDAVSVGTSGGA